MGYYAFENFVSEGGRKTLEEGEELSVIDREKLKEIISEFDTKEAVFENVLSNPPDLVDPSL